MKKIMKGMYRDAMGIGITGIGLSAMASATGEAGATDASKALGKIGSGLGTIGSLSMAGHTMDMIKHMQPKKKIKF